MVSDIENNIDTVQVGKNNSYYIFLDEVKKLYISKEYDAAISNMCIIQDIYPEHFGEIEFYKGCIFEKEQKFLEAEKAYRQAIKAEPDNYWLFYKLSLYYKKIENYKMEWKVLEIAYRKYRFFEEDYRKKDVGIEYILDTMIKYTERKNKKIRNKIYKTYASKIYKQYENIDKMKTYNYLFELEE